MKSEMKVNLRHLWSNRKIRIGAVVVALFIGVAVGCCAFLRISRPADLEAYFGMAAECHPVWKQFALRRFGAGDSAAELLRRFPPDQREEFGRYGVYSYGGPLAFTGLAVHTRDGKLLNASTGSCTWRFTFFQTHDPEFQRQFVAYFTEKNERRQRERRQRLEAQK